MKSQIVWLLLVSVLLVCGVIRGAEKPQPDVKAVAARKECSQRLRLPVEITNSIGMQLKLIPAGEFMMGSRKTHRVRIAKPFCLGVYEVTQAEYERVMKGTRVGFRREDGVRIVCPERTRELNPATPWTSPDCRNEHFRYAEGVMSHSPGLRSYPGGDNSPRTTSTPTGNAVANFGARKTGLYAKRDI